ncbi:hypothetical protein J2R99_001574 [Rhodopseudomonas julia]|uniref:Uncharacterized protein n=1 Tax=Rhodopseudomonas julia TaxID=200617 RepID=A0ABU0C5D1_9BRAD|nr:hypothetical protein [Rhodopseudomonas julia]MDQ0325725.1 hypothetical protein [Rhodopseudomonas julia]
MTVKSSLPHVVREQGVSDRYLYWSGASGRRYLFSRLDLEHVLSLKDAVVLCVKDGALWWVGSDEALDPADILRFAADGAIFYAHFLAGTGRSRQLVSEDLSCAESPSEQRRSGGGYCVAA